MSSPNDVERYYDQSAQQEWDRLDRHRMEFAISLRILLEHLPPPPARIFDLGGGPGRYSIALAQCGYSVTLADLSEANLALARQKAQEAGVQLDGFLHANALDLTHLTLEPFDAVLMMGPLYHLLEQSEKLQAIAQALKQLKPAGLLCAAFITRFASLRDVAANFDEYQTNKSQAGIEDFMAYEAEILATGKHHRTGPGMGFTNAYFAHPDEIMPLMESAGLQTLDLIGCQGILSGHETAVNKLTGKLWQDWVELTYRMCRTPSLRGASDHLLYVGRKIHQEIAL